MSDDGLAGNPALPLLSDPVLAELLEDIGPEQADRFLRDFVRQGGELVSSLAEPAADPETREALRKRVHRLAGSAALFGAVRLRDHLAETETAQKRGHGVEARLAALPALWEATSAAISDRPAGGSKADGPAEASRDPQLEEAE